MYESHFGFREKPFSILPDPGFLYPSRKHSLALAMLEYGLMNQAGFNVITGDIGTGKTTLIRHLLARHDAGTTVGLISHTHRTFGELLQWILFAFKLDAGGRDKVEMFQTFVEFLVREYSASRRTLLIVDEAQNMSIDTLEELRMLSNINADKDQLLQVILVGQGELQDTLRRPELRQFAQRVAVTYHLDPLDREDTRAYIQHRIIVAGASETGLFTDEACEAVYRHSGGVPRLINLLCDAALVYAYAERALQVDRRLVDDVASDKKKGGLFPEQPQTRRGDGRLVATRSPGAESTFDNVATLTTQANGRGGETVRNVDTEIVDYLKLRHADLYDKLRQAVNAMLHKTG